MSRKLKDPLESAIGCKLFYEFGEIVLVSDVKTAKEKTTFEKDEIRKSGYALKKYGYDITKSKTVSGSEAFFIDEIKEVKRKNKLTLVIVFPHKMTPDVKNLYKECVRVADGSDFINLKLDMRSATYNPFLVLNWGAGVLMVFAGSTSLFKSTAIKTKFIEGLNALQLIGIVMIAAALVPYAYKYVKMFLASKKADAQ